MQSSAHRLRLYRLPAVLAAVAFMLLTLTAAMPFAPADAAECPDAGGGTLPALAKAHDDDNYVTFAGRGWGHGVGMSQYGARGAANLGCNATQILTTYYPGTSVQERTPSSDIRVGLLRGRTAIDVDQWPRITDLVVRQRLLPDPACQLHLARHPQRLQRRGTGHQRKHPAHRPRHGQQRSSRDHQWQVRRLPLGHDGVPVLGHQPRLRADGPGRDPGTAARALHVRDPRGAGHWPTETLRAQVIAARSYAQRRMGSNFSGCACNVLDNTTSQVYAGGSPDSRWRAAVDATATPDPAVRQHDRRRRVLVQPRWPLVVLVLRVGQQPQLPAAGGRQPVGSRLQQPVERVVHRHPPHHPGPDAWASAASGRSGSTTRRAWGRPAGSGITVARFGRMRPSHRPAAAPMAA
jgi:hypothetical protein